MNDETIGIKVTAEQQERLARLLHYHPDLGNARGISPVEDELARAIWDALPA